LSPDPMQPLPRPLASLVFLGVALALAPVGPLGAQSTAAPARATAATKLSSVEGITEYTLPNGLRVLLFPDASKPTATVNITYLVGSRYENYGETGMAHLLAQLMLQGTPSIASVFQELGRRSMRFHGSTSAERRA